MKHVRKEDIRLKRVKLSAISVLRVVTPLEHQIRIRSAHHVWVDTLNLSKVRVSVWHVCLEPSRTDLRAVREVTDIMRVHSDFVHPVNRNWLIELWVGVFKAVTNWSVVGPDHDMLPPVV